MRAAILDHTVADILDSKNPLVVAQNDELVPVVLQRMAKHEVLSIPIMENGKLKGLFDVLDYVALVFASEQDIPTMPVSRARNASHHDVCLTVSPADGLFTLAEIFSRGVHRACVVENSVVIGVVSQSSLLSFLAKHLPCSALDVSLETAHLVHPAAHVDTKAPLRAALLLMHEAGHEAVAVTGENGRLEGSVSVCSLRGLTVDELHGLLDRPAGEFAVTRTRDMITTTAQATVAATIVAVAKARAHHVWLKDEGRHLKGIVTLSDLVRIAMKVN